MFCCLFNHALFINHMCISSVKLKSMGAQMRLRPSSFARHYRVLHKKIDGGTLTGHRSKLNPWSVSTRRTIIGGIVRSLPRLLKFRYLFVGGTITGGVAAGKV